MCHAVKELNWYWCRGDVSGANGGGGGCEEVGKREWEEEEGWLGWVGWAGWLVGWLDIIAGLQFRARLALAN
ncbi:hypothetical protein M0804_012398 [Polistes exclamans]|nr:hypothetical protein M0804_012398 [Polistes exclamans]